MTTEGVLVAEQLVTLAAEGEEPMTFPGRKMGSEVQLTKVYGDGLGLELCIIKFPGEGLGRIVSVEGTSTGNKLLSISII